MAEVKDDEGENSVIDNWANTHDTSLCDSEAAEWHHFAQASSDHWDVSYSCGLFYQNVVQPEGTDPSSKDLIEEKLRIIHRVLQKSWNIELAN